MPDNRFDQKRVSDEWDVVLTAARKHGVRFHLNSGRRTMSEQWWLYRHQPPVAAFPSPSAPHIRIGRPDHAIDVDSLDGGESRLQTWLQSKGVHPTNPVPGESWHLELPAPELKRLAARLDDSTADPVLRRGVVDRDAVRRVQRLLRGLNVKGVPLNGRYDVRTRRGVRRWQKKHHLPVDGVVGPKTWAALRRAAS